MVIWPNVLDHYHTKSNVTSSFLLKNPLIFQGFMMSCTLTRGRLIFHVTEEERRH